MTAPRRTTDRPIPDQDIRFAAVLSDIATLGQSDSTFGVSFKTERYNSERGVSSFVPRGRPLQIDQGENLVLYASCEVHHEPGKLFEGTVFPQGIFFAHEREKPASITENAVGLTDSLYKTKPKDELLSTGQWQR